MEEAEEVMGDRHISRKRKGNVLSSCVTPAYINVLEAMALTKKQQEEIQVCKNNLVRIIVGDKRANKIKWMRLEVGVKESSKMKLVRSIWAVPPVYNLNSAYQFSNWSIILFVSACYHKLLVTTRYIDIYLASVMYYISVSCNLMFKTMYTMT